MAVRNIGAPSTRPSGQTRAHEPTPVKPDEPLKFDGFDPLRNRLTLDGYGVGIALPTSAANMRGLSGRAHTTRVVDDPVVEDVNGLLLTSLRAMPVWPAFSPLQRAQLNAMMVGGDMFSKRVRWGLQNEIEEPGYADKAPAQQAAALFAALSRTPILPGNVAMELGALNHDALEYDLGAAVLQPDYAFRSKVTDANKFDLNVGRGEKRISIFEPHDLVFSKPFQHTPEEVAQAIAELPAESRALLSTVRLAPDANVDDALWAKLYATGGFVSYMSCDAVGTLDVYPTNTPNPIKNIMENLNHEAGHVWSLRAWGYDETTPAWEPWRQAVLADGLPVSSYGKSSLREDVAEATALFLSVRGTPKFEMYQAMYPHRFALLSEQFAGRRPN